jgi:hypothetical protein
VSLEKAVQSVKYISQSVSLHTILSSHLATFLPFYGNYKEKQFITVAANK